jgi:hypothetical protein
MEPTDLISEHYRTLTPAFGRDYRAAKFVKSDWEKLRDFYIQPEGRLINRSQFRPGTKVNIRYRGNTLVVVVTA